jgi:chondroitin 4-sulfotransferase 11
LRQQHDWLVRQEGSSAIDFVGRFENLADSVQTINKRLGINIALPHENRSEHRDYRSYYNDETRRHVAVLFAKDIETWGYKFD